MFRVTSDEGKTYPLHSLYLDDHLGDFCGSLCKITALILVYIIY